MPVSWHPRHELVAAARAHLREPDVLLDIGCGIRPQTLVVPRVHVCCEPFPEYAAHLQSGIREGTIRADVVLQLSWADALRSFPEKSVDSVVLLDVIEHLDKEEGARLLRDTLRIARRQIVLFTPLGFMPQEATDTRDAWGLQGGDVQLHKSGWSPDDFDDAWRIVASRDFHATDGFGKPLTEPFGAFFAIRDLGPSLGPAREANLRRLIAEASSFQNAEPGVLARTLDLIATARRVNMPGMLAPVQLTLRGILALRDSWVGRLTHRAILKARRSGS